ncbi:MAG: ABC transporter ATP-binding protein [Dactylosporangium sp.]|nr:ABC transporter ATP-binding protein/permease [Dactylosporangium sp.]NNJ63832.1 ABC transporter ATP-binding protein [Dactylosporangium sp.]
MLLLAQNLAGMAGPYLIKIGIDQGIPALTGSGRDATVLAVTAGLFALASAIEYAGKRGFMLLYGRIGQSALLDLRQRVFDHFQRLSMSFHERYTSGRMVSRLTSDMDSIAELTDGGLNELVVAALSVVSVAGVLLWLDPPLAAVTMLSFPFLLVLSRWFQLASARAYRRTRETVARLIVHFVESLDGIRAVQAFRREGRNEQIFEGANEDYRRANLTALRSIAILSPGIMLIGNVTLAVVLTYGGYRVLHGQLEIGVLTAFLLYLRRFFDPMQQLSQFYNSLQSATAALEKLADVLGRRPGVPEPPRPVALPRHRARGQLRLDNVQFGYRADQLILPALDLVVPAGQTLALVGTTGGGKTTIARLIARFYDPLDGAVSIDGVDLRHLSERDLRRSIVMVTQENYLFAGTIADNIRFGRPSASLDEIAQAAKAIGAATFIDALPDAYRTRVHRRGGRLSAGQRQLVAFARAFLADPAVLILDEATSSLDIPSERLVQRALRTIMSDRTAVVIAHRLSTVEIADRVLVLDRGRIVEDGRPTDLVAAGGRYADLHRQWLNSLG